MAAVCPNCFSMLKKGFCSGCQGTACKFCGSLAISNHDVCPTHLTALTSERRDMFDRLLCSEKSDSGSYFCVNLADNGPKCVLHRPEGEKFQYKASSERYRNEYRDEKHRQRVASKSKMVVGKRSDSPFYTVKEAPRLLAGSVGTGRGYEAKRRWFQG